MPLHSEVNYQISKGPATEWENTVLYDETMWGCNIQK